MRSFVVLLLMCASVSCLAQEAFEANVSLSLISFDPEYVMEVGHEREGLYVVRPKDKLRLSVRALFTRMGESEVLVTLSESVPVRAYERGEIAMYELSEFVIEVASEKLNKIMKLRPNHFANVGNGTSEDALNFINQVENSEGVTEAVSELMDQTSPLRLVELESMILFIEGERVLKEGRSSLQTLSYRATPLGDVFSVGRGINANYMIKDMGEAFSPDDPFIERYLAAIRDLRARNQALEARGWSFGFLMGAENQRALSEGEETIDYTNVVSPLMAPSCKKVF
jgi:hypothetical protein